MIMMAHCLKKVKSRLEAKTAIATGKT